MGEEGAAEPVQHAPKVIVTESAAFYDEEKARQIAEDDLKSPQKQACITQVPIEKSLTKIKADQSVEAQRIRSSLAELARYVAQASNRRYQALTIHSLAYSYWCHLR